MASYTFDFKKSKQAIEIYDDINGVWIHETGIRPKKTDLQGVFSFKGKYRNAIEIITENFRASKLKEFYGFEAIVLYNSEVDDPGDIKYQVSTDNGANWLYFDSANWVVAGPSDFNDLETMDIEFKNLSAVSKQVKFKIVLEPSADQFDAPILQSIRIHHELENYVWGEDIQRSMKHFVENNIRPELIAAQMIEEDSIQIMINTEFRVKEVLAIYNLNTDPDRQTNIFDSLVLIPLTIDEFGNQLYRYEAILTGTQPEGDTIEVNYVGVAPVFIAADDEEIIAKLPVFVLRFSGEVTENKKYRNYDRKLELSETTYRVRQQPTFNDVDAEISAMTKYGVDSMAMIKAAERILSDYIPGDKRPIKSEMTGETIHVFDYFPSEDRSDKKSGKAEKASRFLIGCREWVNLDYKETLAATENVIRVENL